MNSIYNLILFHGVHESGNHEDQYPDDGDDGNHPAPHKARAGNHAVNGVDAQGNGDGH